MKLSYRLHGYITNTLIQMPQREFEITIGPDGGVELHVKGYKGKSCLEVMKIFEQATAEAPAPLTTTRISSSFRCVT